MGFFELLIIAVVILLVVGPERMPEAVRSVALNIGRIKRMLRNTRQEIEQQLGADDIRRQLHNEEIMASLESTREEMEAMIKAEHGTADQKQAEKDSQANPAKEPSQTELDDLEEHSALASHQTDDVQSQPLSKQSSK